LLSVVINAVKLGLFYLIPSPASLMPPAGAKRFICIIASLHIPHVPPLIILLQTFATGMIIDGQKTGI
jgi:hypothetical protein